jgi:hypothetical protein
MVILIAQGPPPKRPLSSPSVLQNSTNTLSWPIVVLHRSFCDNLPSSSVPVGIKFRWPSVSVLDLLELHISLLRPAPRDLELLSCETLYGYIDRLGSSSEKVLA